MWLWVVAGTVLTSTHTTRQHRARIPLPCFVCVRCCIRDTYHSRVVDMHISPSHSLRTCTYMLGDPTVCMTCPSRASVWVNSIHLLWRLKLRLEHLDALPYRLDRFLDFGALGVQLFCRVQGGQGWAHRPHVQFPRLYKGARRGHMHIGWRKVRRLPPARTGKTLIAWGPAIVNPSE